jgi:hypothetical protein
MIVISMSNIAYFVYQGMNSVPIPQKKVEIPLEHACIVHISPYYLEKVQIGPE